MTEVGAKASRSGRIIGRITMQPMRPMRWIRRLTKAEIEAYDLVPPELAERVVLVTIGFLPGGYAGITLGRFVFLTRMAVDDGAQPLLAHELIHVRQWTELGVVGFSFRYLRDFVVGLSRSRRWRRAYLDIEAEREARRLATSWARDRLDHPGQAGV